MKAQKTASTPSKFSNEVGVQAPLGFWDPLGLLMNADQERFDNLRKYEVKHGRISMLAVLGHMVTTAGYRCGGDIAFGVPFSSVKNGLAAIETIPAAGVAQIIGFIGLLEFGFEYQEKNIASECVQRMTDFGWNEATQRKKASIELNNGRAAQMGILALMVHERLNNNPYIINSLLGSPIPFNQ
eukprot:CAMPEP_0119045260 /NCGR_PEP_ID=MMETSP1177-20130426/38590_1 /TAXON_ID=2985 /ORGANISM="Ochromonas sp, Strain CCMP1899" /LENGTH=183 /DNA_ID=CAMNT_0007016757 /DNA_START=162 /DNA_END=713 /DNA_ORIENTATION=+